MGRRSKTALLLVGLLLAGLLLSAGLLRPTGEHGTPLAPAGAAHPVASHVGSPACQRCHAAEYQAWQGSQHRRAMQPADAQHVLAPFAGERLASTRFSQREGRFYVRTEGPDGKPAEFEIRHTLGLAPLQQYLIAMPGGGLQALDIAWDSRPKVDGGQRWFHLQGSERPRPGDELHWTGRQNNANTMCVDCHVTGFQKQYDADMQRYASRWAEPGVACEACHGPGSRHIAWADSGPPRLRDDSKGLSLLLDERRGVSWQIDALSGNASRSRPASVQRKELDLCARCHSHRSTLGDTPPAGAPLLDSHLPSLLTPELYWPDGQMRAEVYNHGSFLQSRMAARGVSCSDCHEPHSQRLRAAGNAVCAQCHAPQRFEQLDHLRHASGSSGAQCVACHMPTRTFMQIDPRHEHAIRVPRPDASLRFGTPNACTRCHGDKSVHWAAEWAKRWYPKLGHRPLPLAEALRASDRSTDDALPRLLALLGDPQRPAIERATVLARLPLQDLPPAQLQAALASDDALLRHSAVEALAQAPAAVRAAQLPALLGDPTRAVRIAAARALAGAPEALLDPAQQAGLAQGLAEYAAVQRHSADRPEALNNLALLEAERGDLAGAEQTLRRALALAPDLAATQLNLADVQRAAGHEQQAEAQLRALLKREPRHAAAWHALGLSLLRQRRGDEAIRALQRASELAPGTAHFAYVLAAARAAYRR
nr:tetratricopeptide repeat protein [uncultured Roseateles sp.]